MDSKLSCLVLVIFAFAEISTGTPPDQFVKKYISLNEITSQGILHLPPPSHFNVTPTPTKCDFWVSFFSEIPEADMRHHEAFGISIVPSRLELAEGDSIDFMAHPMYTEGHGRQSIFQNQSHGERESWDSSKNLATENLEYKPSLGWQDICINMTGKWNEKKSKATLVITLYFDKVKADYHSEACPDGMSVCECPQSQNRCIYTDLFCNGVANCGAVCGHDENTCSNAGGSSGGQQGSGSETTIQNCEWSNFEYLMMVSMTGLLLILIPAIFLLTMMYHRRTMTLRRSPAIFDGNNNHNAQYPHVITVTPIHDHPPTYNDLPHNVKVESRN